MALARALLLLLLLNVDLVLALSTPPRLPSSFSSGDQGAIDQAWADINVQQCTKWRAALQNSSALSFPSCLPEKPPAGMHCIPRIIHQTWRTKQPRPEWAQLVESCNRTNPNFVHLIWTDEDAREYIAREHSWFLPTFDDYELPIQRADVIRYFILRDFGGMSVCFGGH